MFEKISIPPEPIITRWNSWILAVNYYYKILQEAKKIVKNLEKDGVIVLDAKKDCLVETLYNDIIYIEKNYKVFVETIDHIETKNFTINDAIEATKKNNL